MQYSSCNPTLVSDHLPLPSAEAPAGYPCKNSPYRKNRKRAGDDGKREKAHSAPRFIFLFLQLPHNTNWTVRGRETTSHKTSS